MKLIKPIYVSRFRCKAGNCHDTCCAGWEVDIDEETLRKYDTLPGELGDEIRQSICSGSVPHFGLREDGRCPFLDTDGLCRIISDLGDDWICDICREHPRYYNRLGDSLECGIGLACEAAAELILSCSLPLAFLSEDIPDDKADGTDQSAVEYIRSARQLLFDLAASDADITDTLSLIYDYASIADDRLFDIQAGLSDDNTAPPPTKAHSDIYSILDTFSNLPSSLEALDRDFFDRLKGDMTRLRESAKLESILSAASSFAKRLLTYFIHRYVGGAVDDEYLCGRIRLCVFSTLAICASVPPSDVFDLERFAAVAKDFSKNVEYSTRNIEILTALLS